MSKVPTIGILSQCHRYFMGVKSCLLLLVSFHSQTVEMFCLKIVIQKLNSNYEGEELPSLLLSLQVDVFQEKQGILQQLNLCLSNKPKKTCIRPCDTNNSSQSLTRMSTILQQKVYIFYMVQKLVGHLSQQECSVSLTLLVFQFACNARSPDHQFVLFFSHEVSHHKVRKVKNPSF